MASLLAAGTELSAVISKLMSNPLYVLKPMSTWRDSDPLYFTLFLLIMMTSWTFYKNHTTDNCSYVDRLWSIAPILYSGSMALHYYVQHDYVLNDRLSLMFLLILGCGTSLSYNLYIKGGYEVKYAHI